MSITFKEILNKYNIKEEDFFKNVKESTELKSDSFSGLTLRQTKSLYKEISLYYSSINKTTNSLQNLKNYSETKLQNNILIFFFFILALINELINVVFPVSDGPIILYIYPPLNPPSKI